MWPLLTLWLIRKITLFLNTRQTLDMIIVWIRLIFLLNKMEGESAWLTFPNCGCLWGKEVWIYIWVSVDLLCSLVRRHREITLPASHLFLGQPWHRAGNSQVAVCASLWWEGPVLDLAQWNPGPFQSPEAVTLCSCTMVVCSSWAGLDSVFSHTPGDDVCTSGLGDLICRGFNFKERLRAE